MPDKLQSALEKHFPQLVLQPGPDEPVENHLIYCGCGEQCSYTYEWALHISYVVKQVTEETNA